MTTPMKLTPHPGREQTLASEFYASLPNHIQLQVLAWQSGDQTKFQPGMNISERFALTNYLMLTTPGTYARGATLGHVFIPGLATHQEIFDFTVTRMFGQGGPSVKLTKSHTWTPAYVGEYNCKSPLGHMLYPYAYLPEMETLIGESNHEVLMDNYLVAGFHLGYWRNLELINDLEEASRPDDPEHIDWPYWRMWIPAQLRAVAKSHKLNFDSTANSVAPRPDSGPQGRNPTP